jgi:hypothetical protein
MYSAASPRQSPRRSGGGLLQQFANFRSITGELPPAFPSTCKDGLGRPTRRGRITWRRAKTGHIAFASVSSWEVLLNLG